MKKLLSFLSRSERSPDRRFGRGLWRHNHDRFLRAVDRYYTTAVAIHDGHGDDPPDPAAASARETIIVDTHRLSELATEVDEITDWLHTHCPIDGQVVPGHTRRIVGDTPELLTRASAKVAEAVLAASMARTELSAGTVPTSSAEATRRFISDAAELLAQVKRILAEADVP